MATTLKRHVQRTEVVPLAGRSHAAGGLPAYPSWYGRRQCAPSPFARSGGSEQGCHVVMWTHITC
jgi:hypothetical protein